MNLSDSNVSFLAAFLGGVVVSFTPCVYPLIPISIGYIGIKAGGSRPKAFLLSLIYVSGIAVTYSILGMIASLTGTFFGKISSSPVTYFIVGCIIILFGLSMLNLFAMRLPTVFKQPTVAKKGTYLSAFVIGLSSGLVASPCLTPVLGTILAILAAKKNLFYGATLLVSFAYGMGLVLILAGTFSGLLVSIPKSGKWMVYIERIYSFVLIAVGIYFIYVGLRRI